MTKRKLVIIISAAVATLVAVVVGVMLGVANSTPNHESVKQESFKEMEKLLTSENEVPPTSMVVTPSTEKWWDTMFPFRGSVQYERVSYKALEKDSTKLIFSNSNPESYEAFDVFQMPTAAIVYKTEDAAKNALEALSANSDYAGVTQVKNLVILHPEGSYADEELTTGALEKGLTKESFESWGVKEGQAYWYLNLSAFKESYSDSIEKKEDKEIFNELSKKVGIGENTYWVGTSTDASEWDGRFYGVNLKDFSPTAINSYIADQLLALQTDGEWIRGGKGVDAGTYSGIVEPAQSVLQSYSAFATKDKAVGSVFTYGSEEPTKLEPLEKNSKYFAHILIDPNAWVGYLKGQDSQANRVIYASTADVLIALDGTAKIKLDLITRDEYIASLEEEMNNASTSEENVSGYDVETEIVEADPDTTEPDLAPLTEGE